MFDASFRNELFIFLQFVDKFVKYNKTNRNILYKRPYHVVLDKFSYGGIIYNVYKWVRYAQNARGYGYSRHYDDLLCPNAEAFKA